MSHEQNKGNQSVNEETKPKTKKRKRSKRNRKQSLNRLNWEERARSDVKLMWQISIGEGFDVCPGQQEFLYQNDWTPTEQDLRLLYHRKKGERNKDFNSFVFSPRPSQASCGKENCFFEEGSVLYL
ncbi:uncharacterized protein LOC114972026 [Acropora millepora]|uniref:uncharacterized protein LOC114972026 n=1 Tax=Acropora millepora TaxID=45264 RepID=UPI001CF17172|nr:uncharacterized protein LOC114972026 [Acropora millepora]